MAGVGANGRARNLRVYAVSAFGRGLSLAHFRGKGRLGMRAARLASRVSTEAYCSPCRGATMRVDLRDRIQTLMWCGAYERETKLVFHVFISRGSTVVDVGANVGYFSVLAAALAGEAGGGPPFLGETSFF